MLKKLINGTKEFGVGYVLDLIKIKFRMLIVKLFYSDNIAHDNSIGYMNLKKKNDFKNEKITVYSCLIGNYDKVVEPDVNNANVEFIMFTDQEIPEESKWKRIEVTEYLTLFDNNPVLVNRYIKMHPDVVLSDRNLTVYIDSNVQILDGFEENFNLITSDGFLTHRHSDRNSILKELMAIKTLKKDSVFNIKRNLAYIKTNNIQTKLLLECNVIYRQKNESSNTINKIWWETFLENPNRDQIAIIFALRKLQISEESLAKLGVGTNNSKYFKVTNHQRGK